MVAPLEPKAPLTSEQREAVDDFRKRHRTGVLTLLFSDMISSMQIKRELGDAAGIDLIAQHRTVIREVLSSFHADEAEEVSTAGDSFFIVFIKPSDAVRFALRVQSRMRRISQESRMPIQVRIGIHMGEVFIQEEAGGRLKRDVLGTQVDSAWYITSAASGGQILMTRSVFNNARTILKGEALTGLRPLTWLNHGLYSVKGLEEALELCEVGEEDLAPLVPPADSPLARRTMIAEGEAVLGWRPALDQMVPGTEWTLDRKLGEGGFGEVWRAKHRRTSDMRVFKFCFRADQLRNLKREVTFFRILKEVLGERPDIARLYDVQFAEPPFYLELEYTPGGDLGDWLEARGGIEKLPMDSRIEIIAQIGAALSAAHSVGVIHKDVKPSNVLVEDKPDGAFQIRLTDFGIGQFADRTALERAGITATGFTEGAGPEISSQYGTRLYMAPELLAGREPSIQSDIYSLGVLFYQMVIGDLSQPMVTDWKRRVEDAFLCEDIERCVAGDPSERFASADELSEQLRSLPARRQEVARKQQVEYAAAQRRLFGRVLAYSFSLLLLVAIFLGIELWREHRRWQETQSAYYYSAISQAIKYLDQLRYDRVAQILKTCPARLRQWEWGRLLYQCNTDLMTFAGHSRGVHSVALSSDGKQMATGGQDGTVIIWELDTGAEIKRLKSQGTQVESVAWHPKDKVLAVGGDDGLIRLWNLASGKLEYKLPGHERIVTSVAFSADGRWMVSGSYDSKAIIWDYESKTISRIFKPQSGRVWTVSLTPDSRYLVAGTDADYPIVYDLSLQGADSRKHFQDPAGGDVSQAVAVSPDRKCIATADWNGIARIWDLETGTVATSFTAHTWSVTCAAFSPDGKILATGSWDKRVNIWEVGTWELIRSFEGHSGMVLDVEFTPDGRRLISAGAEGTAKLWAIESPPEELVPADRQPPVLTLAFSADSGLLATGDIYGYVRLWDTRTRTERLNVRGIGRMVFSVAYDPTGAWFAAGYSNGSVTVWDARTCQEHKTFQAHNNRVADLAFSPDGKTLATVSGHRFASDLPMGDKQACLWNVETGEKIATLNGHKQAVNSIAFSPDGKWVVTASWDESVRIWDAATGNLKDSLNGNHDEVLDAAFSPNGGLLATAHGDGTTILWDLDRRSSYSLRGHFDTVYAVAFSPDGKRMVTVSVDGAAILWDVDMKTEIQTLSGHKGQPRDAAFSPDGRYLATCGIDGLTILRTSFPWSPATDTATGKEGYYESLIRKFKDDHWSAYRAAMRCKLPVLSAVRSASAKEFSPGEAIQIQLDLTMNSGATSLSVMERLPSGWTASAPSDGGIIVGSQIRWDLHDVAVPGVRLTYLAMPSQSSGSHPVVFADATVKCLNGWRRIEDTYLSRKGVSTFQNGSFPDKNATICSDTHVLVHHKDSNPGGCWHLEEGAWPGKNADEETTGGGDHKKILIQFDLESVPPNTTINSAKLKLFAFGERNLGCRTTHTLYVAPILKQWGEGNAINDGSRINFDGDYATSGCATFVHAKHDLVEWERPGILGRTDVADAESSSTAGCNWPGWVTFDVTKSVRDFVARRVPNNGWKISQDLKLDCPDNTIEYASGIYMYISSESPLVRLRPLLLIETKEATDGGASP